MEQSDYRDRMTIGEIKANDEEMAKDAIKNCKRFTFPHTPQGKQKAHLLMGVAVEATMKRLGIIITPQTSPEKAEKKMALAQVSVEDRGYYKGEKEWRNGIYIYQRGELVAFISAVMEKNPPPSILMLPGTMKTERCFAVFTNAKLDDKYLGSKANFAPVLGRTLCHGGGA